ncbi:tyrosine-protein kinase BAZ1B [Ciona intestinalis]
MPFLGKKIFDGGVMSSGVTSSGVTPPEVTSSGVTSSGVTSSGVTSSGVTSSGVTSPVVTPPEVTSPVVTSSEVTSPKGTSSGPGVTSSPAVTSSDVTSPVVTPPEVTSPDVTSPDVTSPGVTSPAVTSSDVTSPVVTPPEVTSPDVTSPDVTSPDVTSPGVTSPVVTSPDVTSRDVTSSVVTSSEVTSPEVTSPDVTSSVVTSSERTSSEVTSQKKKFTIPHTKETFDDENEYTERLKLYEKRVWTCQCTGHINLTHENAMLSEAACRERLLQAYDEVWMEPVLKLVHHSFLPLESIVAQAYNLLLTNYVHGETVKFTAKPGVSFDAKIEEKHLETNEVDLNKTDETEPPIPPTTSDVTHVDNGETLVDKPATVSPSSDKENKRQSLITDIFKTDIRRSTRSPSAVVRSGVSLKRRLKIIPAKYNILLVEENKIVSKVPTEHLSRTMKPPNRDNIRLFIRSSAVRPNNSKKKIPWIVSEDLVCKYSLPSRITPEEVTELLQLSTITTQQYFNNSDSVSLFNGHNNCNGDIIEVEELEEFKSQQTKKRKSEKLSLSPNKKARKEIKEGKSPLDAFLKKASKIVKEDIINGDNSLQRHGSSRKSASPKKKKQATLLELTKKGSIKMMSSRAPTKPRSTGKSRKPRQPLIILQLLSLKKEKRFRAHKYKLTVTAACKILTEKQRENLPPEVKDDILKKWELFEFKRKYDSLSISERKAFLAERRKAKRGSLVEDTNQSDKFEDQHLTRMASCRQLPTMELVELPDSLPNTSFGNVAMICEFIHSYHHLLAPKEPAFHKQFNFNNVIEAVTMGRKGYALTSRILVVLLQTLLADDIAKDYMELGYRLNQVQVTPTICCELMRICLRQNDDELDEEKSDSNSNSGSCDSELADSTFRRMYELELYDMEPPEQIDVLAALTYRVMNTYAVQIHIEDTTEKATTIYKKVLQQKKEKKLYEVPKKNQPKDEPSIDPYFVKNPIKPEDLEDEGIDLVSRVKKRKMLSEKHRREEEERRRRIREEEEVILQEQRSKQESERADRQLEETRTLARHLRRRLPLGTDRNHSRYWLFCDGIPGFYVEKGWVNDNIDYSTHVDPTPATPKKAGGSPTKSPKKRMKLDHSSDDDVPLAQMSPSKKPRFRKSKEEVTWPHVGLNLWHSIDDQQQLDQLVSSLCKNGIRESRLIKSIRKHYDLIVKSMERKKQLLEPSDAPARRSGAPSDGEELHRSFVKKNMRSMIHDACRGGLATVTEPEVLEQRVEVAETVQEFALLLLEFHEHIMPNCFKPYLAVNSETASDRERAKAAKRLLKWRQAVEEVSLFSRFTLLFTFLNTSIKWEMYHYQRISRRRVTRNRNYADINNGVIDEEESEEDDETIESEEEMNQRRSSRLRQRKGTKKVVEEVRERRVTRKPRYMDEYDDDDDDDVQEQEEEEEEEEQMEEESEEEGGSESGEEQEEEEEEEEDEGLVCKRIIEKLIGYQYSELFRHPVDVSIVPDYYDIVTRPISLHEIVGKIDGTNLDVGLPFPRSTRRSSHNNYTYELLMDDMKLLVDNAALYNSPDSYTMKQARRLELSFVRLCKDNFDTDELVTRLNSLFKRK